VESLDLLKNVGRSTDVMQTTEKLLSTADESTKHLSYMRNVEQGIGIIQEAVEIDGEVVDKSDFDFLQLRNPKFKQDESNIFDMNTSY